MTDRADLPARLRGDVTEATLRLIAGAFRRDGEQLSSDRRPRFSIPTRPTEDDDCVVIDGLKEAAARIEALEAALAENDRAARYLIERQRDQINGRRVRDADEAWVAWTTAEVAARAALSQTSKPEGETR